MSKRLTELLRQKALLQEHLTWLDREIASEQGITSSAPTTPPAANAATSLPPVLPSKPPAEGKASVQPAELDVTAEKIIGKYQQDLGALGQDTRKGCLLYFGIALGATFLLAGIAYVLYARHLGRWW